VQFGSNSAGVNSVENYEQANNPYYAPDNKFRMQRKNLASAKVFVRKHGAGVISITDSMSHPDLSMGPGPEIFSTSGTKTAGGTDSVRPVSVRQPALKLPSTKREMQFNVNVRPVTVGGG